MTYAEAQKAMIANAPVIYRDITYKGIYGFIFRKSPTSKNYIVSAELLDKCGRSITLARLGRIELASGSPDDLPEVYPPNEDGPSPDEANAKRAMQTGRRFDYHGEPHFVSAIILRNWQEVDYWMHVELTRCRDGKVTEDWVGCVPPETGHKK